VSGNVFNADNAMTSFGSQTLGYDANGNLTAPGNDTYTRDASRHNRSASISFSSLRTGSPLPSRALGGSK